MLASLEIFMETKIKCRNCGRTMDFWEFLPYVEVYLGKLAVEAGLATLLIAALKNYFLSGQTTRGIINEHITSYAHILKIKCPQCKKLGVWDPVSENISAEIKIDSSTEKTSNKLIL